MNTSIDTISLGRPIYVFSDQIPDQESLYKVVSYGNKAPYPPPEPLEPCGLRRFFVFRTGTKMMSDLEVLCLSAIEKTLEELISFFGWRAYSPEGPGTYIQMLKNYQVTGIPGFHTAPYIIILTESRRFPPVEQESVALAIQNMWIMAGSLGFGVHLIPGLHYLSRKPAFFTMVGLPAGKYAVNGLAIGYPPDELKGMMDEADNEVYVRWYD